VEVVFVLVCSSDTSAVEAVLPSILTGEEISFGFSSTAFRVSSLGELGALSGFDKSSDGFGGGCNITGSDGVEVIFSL
jgi:hypothetical protein